MKNGSKLHLAQFLEKYRDLAFLENNITEAVAMIVAATRQDKTLFLAGNGGSAADCEHMAGELLKSFALQREMGIEMKNSLVRYCGEKEGAFLSKNLSPGVRCVPLTSFPSFQTAFGNDCLYELSFAQLVNVLGRENDVLIVFSTSGNSPNICHAAKVAHALRMKVIAFTGEGGGNLKNHAHLLLNAPASITYQVQEYHLPLYHVICIMTENELFGSK